MLEPNESCFAFDLASSPTSRVLRMVGGCEWLGVANGCGLRMVVGCEWLGVANGWGLDPNESCFAIGLATNHNESWLASGSPVVCRVVAVSYTPVSRTEPST